MTTVESPATVTGMPRIGDAAPAFTARTTADHFSVATPADWLPGDRVIVPPAGSCGTAKDRMEGHEAGVECEDWFFCTRELPADEVESAIHRG